MVSFPLVASAEHEEQEVKKNPVLSLYKTAQINI